MGNTHWRSNLVGFAGSESITGFDKVQGDDVVCGTLTATKVSVAGTLSGAARVNMTGSIRTPSLRVNNYVKLGTRQYMFFGPKNTGASIIAAATALVGTPIKGSLYLAYAGPKPKMYIIMTDATASPVNMD